MGKSPLARMIAVRVFNRDASNIPIPKYMLALTIDANTLEELQHEVEQFALDMAVDWLDQERIDSTTGRRSVRLDVTNGAQTPERYGEQLAAWSADRKAARAAEGTEQPTEETS